MVKPIFISTLQMYELLLELTSIILAHYNTIFRFLDFI